MNIDTMRLLVAKGLSAEDILEVAGTMAAPAGRSAGAERQARYRARLKGEDVTESVTSDVTRDGDIVTEAPLSLPPNDIYSNPPTHTPVITTRTRKGLDRPDGVEPQVWTDFVEHRKRLKAPPSQTAVDGIRREAVKAGVTLNDALSECVSQGWRGFRADWLASKPARNSTASNDAGDLVKSILARSAAGGP